MEKLDKTIKYILGTIAALIALYLGKLFWICFIQSFKYLWTIFGIFCTLIWLGYIYIAVNLITLKKWAYNTFLFIISLAIPIQILLILVGGASDNLIQGLQNCVFGVSSVVIPVFGISALIRRVIKKRSK